MLLVVEAFTSFAELSLPFCWTFLVLGDVDWIVPLVDDELVTEELVPEVLELVVEADGFPKMHSFFKHLNSLNLNAIYYQKLICSTTL